MKLQENLEELRRNNIRAKALVNLYEKLIEEKARTEKEKQLKEAKAEYIRKEILKATTASDKILRKMPE